MAIVTERQEFIYPRRIVKAGGEVLRAEQLLEERSLALLSTFKEEQTACFQKTGAENPYLLLDLGKEIQGGVRLVIPRSSKKNMRVHLTFGESVTEALSTVGESSATNDHSPRDLTVDISSYSVLDFGRTGFRFVKVELVEEGTIWFKNIVGVLRTPDIDKKGYLECSDKALNEILDVATYTAFLCVQDGVIWDGIKRDRLVWSGDLNTELLTLAYTYGALPNMKNCLQLLREDTPDNVWMNNIPSYSVWWVLNLVDYCYLSGDEQFFKDNIDYVNYVLRDLDGCVGEEDVDFARTGKPANGSMAFFLDWPSAGKPDAFAGTMMLILYTMRKLRLFESMPFDKEAAARVEKRLEKYVSLSAEMKQTLAMQAVCGNDALLKALEKGGALGFSTFMAYFLLKGLDACGSEKTLALAKDFYGGMLSRGATTFWEDFSMDWLEGSGRIDAETPAGLKDIHSDYGDFCYVGLRHSLCHGWASGIVGYFVENVLGVEIKGAGFKKVKISPKLHGLEWVKGSIPTPYGNIEVYADEGGKYEVKLPEGVERVE